MFRTESPAPVAPEAGEEEGVVGGVKREGCSNTGSRADPIIVLIMN